MRAIPLVPLLLGWLALPAHADDAQDRLNRLALAEQQQSYTGTFVYERNGSFSTHRIWQRVADGKVREHLIQLDGSPQEVLRVNGATQCVSGVLEDGVSNIPDSPARAFNASRLSSWYDIKTAGTSRVAGRSAVVVTLTPRDQHRYGIELHLDSESGLPLKSLLLSDKGQLLERFQFTDFSTSQAPTEQMLLPSADCKAVQTVKAKTDVKQNIGWRSEWLPPGFDLISSASRNDPDTKSRVTSLMYDDGLARFSVFVEPVNGAAVTDIRTQLGPTVAVSRKVTTPKGEAMVTVVGEIPIGTAERIALSMRDDAAAATSKN
jgi:sigma-E factor negative regulatory protein RseB